MTNFEFINLNQPFYISFHFISFCSFTNHGKRLDSFDYSDQMFPNRAFPVQSKINGYYRQIQHILITRGNKFHLNRTILLFQTNYPKKGISVHKEKSSTLPPSSAHSIRINLCTILHLKKIILIFFTKFPQKGYFSSKTEEINVTIEFHISN